MAAGFGETGTFFEEVGASRVSLLRSPGGHVLRLEFVLPGAKGAPQASMVTRRRCWQRSEQIPRQRSFPSGIGSIGVSCQREFSFLRHFRRAETMSLTIFETSASTVRSSPMARLMG